jgi:hypothetical protein
MKRKNRKSPKERKVQNKKRYRITRPNRSSRKHSRVRRQKVTGRKRGSITDPRVLRALGLIRRERYSASKAARREKIKLKTLVKRGGRALYRSGPGKPWKVRGEDQLSASMTVLTNRGPLTVIVRNSRERKLLGRYDTALRMFRAGEDTAEAALKAFERKIVGGYPLITDPKVLIQLEEAGQLDFDSLYTSFGAAS